MKNKLFNNKIAKGLVSLIAIIILLSSILAGSIFYENNITANVIKETSIDDKSTISIKEVNAVKELNQLNEGWYEIRNGFVFYLDTFNSYVPLYIKISNLEQQNGLLVIDSDGNVRFDNDARRINDDVIVNEEDSTQNQITEEATGLEGVSGFATKEYNTLDLAISGYNKKEFAVGDSVKIGNQEYVVRGNVPRSASEIQQPILFKPGSNIGETLFGSKAVYLNQQQEVVIAPNTPILTALNLKADTCSDDLCKQKDGSYILRSEKVQSTALKPPVFDINNPDKFILELDAFIQKTDKTAPAQQDSARAQPLIAAATYLRQHPTDPKARENYDLEKQKWQIYQESKGNPYTLIVYLTSSDQAEQSLARNLIIQRRNEQEVRDALSSTASASNADIQVTELNRLVQLEQSVSNFKAKVDFNTGELIDSKGTRGWGLKSDGTIDPNVKVPQSAQQQLNVLNSYVQEAYKKYSEQEGAERLTQKDGKLYDNYGREVSMSFNSQYLTWEISKDRQSPQTIKTQQGTTLTRTELSLDLGGQLVSLYKDATGKLYDHTGNKVITEGQVIESKKFGTGENAIDTRIVYNLVQGQFDKEKPISAQIGKTPVPAQTYAELLDHLKAAGNAPKVDGEFTLNNPLVIKNEKGDTFALAYGFENLEGIAKGNTIQSNFKNGQPLLITTSSEDGSQRLRIEKELKETEIKDGTGKIIRKEQNIVTKSWTITEDNQVIQGQTISVQTTRVYDLDKNGKQLEDKYTDFKINSVTHEPLYTVIIDGRDVYTVTYFKNVKTIGIFDTEILLEKNGKQLTEAELDRLQKDNPALYDKIKDQFNAHKQYVVRQFFASVERVLTEFQGLGYYAPLFLDQDSLLAWRDNVDRVFATLYLGTEYWSSKICGSYLDGESEGIAYAETPQGLAQVGAHIEATRSEPLITPTGVEFLYKITFNVRNGDYENDKRAPEQMNINVFLKGERTANVFRQDQSVKRGSSFGRVGSNAIVQYSTTLYTEVCLKFSQIPLRWKLDNGELCNTIQGSSGATTTATSATATTTSGGSGAPEGDINDF